MTEEKTPSGILLIDKSEGFTSHDVVARVRKLFGTRSVGHTGTLDPMATGLLNVLVGKAVKASQYVMCDGKTYIASMRLGLTTDTQDITGKTLSESDMIPPAESVISVTESFAGAYMQTPPMYSALKVGGKKLVDLARQGIEVERESRPVNIYSITAEGADRDYSLTVSCSAGTYIRTLIDDIGKKLGCGAVMTGLRRISAGRFSVSDAMSLAGLEALTERERAERLIPVETVFADKRELFLPAFYSRLCVNGCEIYLKKLGEDIPEGELVRLYDGDGALGIGLVSLFDNGKAVRLKLSFRT